MSELKRIIEVEPAYDKRNPDPSKDYGIHGVSIRLVLRGPLGAVQFLLYTNRQLPHIQAMTLKRVIAEFPEISPVDQRKILDYSGDFTVGQELAEVAEWEKFLNKLELSEHTLLQPMAADIGYHSPEPMYEGQQPICHILREPKFDKTTGKITPAIYGDPVICPYVDNDIPCYYDGSTLNAEPIYQIFLKKGEEALWRELEKRYEIQFVKS
jgi:hypothetical protein